MILRRIVNISYGQSLPSGSCLIEFYTHSTTFFISWKIIGGNFKVSRYSEIFLQDCFILRGVVFLRISQQGNKLIDNSTICLDVSWDQLTVRRKSPLGTFMWQMAIFVLSETYDPKCPPNIWSYVLPLISASRSESWNWATQSLAWVLQVPHRVSRESSFPRALSANGLLMGFS